MEFKVSSLLDSKRIDVRGHKFGWDEGSEVGLEIVGAASFGLSEELWAEVSDLVVTFRGDHGWSHDKTLREGGAKIVAKRLLLFGL